MINRLGGFVTTFLALYLTVDRGYSASYAGLVAALYGLGGALSAVVAGILADRFGRRPTLLVSQLTTAAAMVWLGLLRDGWTIAVMATVLGITANAARPCIQAIIADLVPANDQVRAFSLNYWAMNIGFAVASVAAGLIAEHGYLILFFGNAVSVLVCAVVIFCRVPETKPQLSVAAERQSGDVVPDRSATGLGVVLRDGRFMAVVGLSFMIAMVLMQYTTSLPVSMGQAGLSSAEYGVVISVNGLIVVVATLPLTRAVKDREPAKVLILACLLAGYGFGLTAFAKSVPVYMLTVLVWTLGEILNSPTSMALVAALSLADARGRYQGMYTMAFSAAAFTGPLLGGTVIDKFGDDTLWLGCAAIGTVAAAGYWMLSRHVVIQQTTPAPLSKAEATTRADAREVAGKEETKG